MDNLEIIQSGDSLEELISELKPATPITFKNGKYVIDDFDEVVSATVIGFQKVITSLREIYDFGRTVYRGTAKFCLALKAIYDNLKYVEDKQARFIPSRWDEAGVNPSMGCDDEYNFSKIVMRLGLSDTLAYLYKDLGRIVDPETTDFYPEFAGYSISLLGEMSGFLKVMYGYFSIDRFKLLTKVVPKDTTIEKMRSYRKIMKLWSVYKNPFGDSKSHSKVSFETPLSDVIKIYEELTQEEENNRLSNILAESESKAPVQPEELVGNDVLIMDLRRQIEELQRTSIPNLGNCEGCLYQEKNLNKCRCCRRYIQLKDLYKSE